MTLHGRHILVLEDAADVLTVLTMLLRAEGATVVGAATGHDALTALRHDPRLDVVVTDLGLPDIPGDVLIRTIITAARRPVDIVVISGETESCKSRAVRAGAGIVFEKPCHWRSVVSYLEGLTPAPAG